MVDLRQRLGFTRKPLGEVRIRRLVGSQNLEGDQPPQRLLARLVDRSHPAVTDQLHDLQLREHGRQGFHGGRRPGRRRFTPRPSSPGHLFEQTRRTQAPSHGGFHRSTAAWTRRIGSNLIHGHISPQHFAGTNWAFLPIPEESGPAGNAIFNILADTGVVVVWRVGLQARKLESR